MAAKMATDGTIIKKNLSIFSNVRWEHLAAGVTGGVVSTIILHPLDLIKIRFQVNEGSVARKAAVASTRPDYKGITDALVSIGRQAGWRGLYQGVTPNVWGAGASWGLYFLFYNSFKVWLQDRDRVTVLGPGKHMLAAAEAGVLTLMLTNPVWVAKTRICLQYEARNSSRAYTGMFDCLGKIYKAEGMRGLYKGFIPGVFGVSHGALQFMAYEELKKLYNTYREVPPDTKFNSLEYLTFAALSKMFAASTTYPYQVVRSRMQDQHRQYKNIREVLIQTWKFEGLRGFYKGMSPYLLHVTPNICIVFLIYEKVTSYVARKDLENSMATVSMPTAKSSPADILSKKADASVILVTSSMAEPVEVSPLEEFTDFTSTINTDKTTLLEDDKSDS